MKDFQLVYADPKIYDVVPTWSNAGTLYFHGFVVAWIAYFQIVASSVSRMASR